MPNTLTPLGYVARDGHNCPVCRSDNLEAKEIEIPESGSTIQPVVCHNCGSSWNDVYKLEGYDNLTVRANHK